MEAAALLEPFEKMLAQVGTPAALRALDQGGSPDAIWAEIAASGYLDALVPEGQGGAGLTLSDVEPLLRTLGRHAVSLPVGETMVKRALLALEGQSPSDGPLALSDNRPLAAIVATSEMAGCAERLLEMSIAYANDRNQFGKPIAKQQAIQHQLAILGEQALMMRMASQIGCSRGVFPDLVTVATAKHAASSAAAKVAAIAHAIHGAMGITEAFDLQLYTRRLRALRLHAGAESYWAGLLGAERLKSAETPSVAWLAERQSL